MRKILLPLLLLALCNFSTLNLLAQQSVGIGTTTPNTEAILDLDPSSPLGLLMPRLVLNDTNSFSTIAANDGMIFYATDINAFVYYDATTTYWTQVGSGAGGSAGADGLTSLITATPEPPGVNCAEGGQRIDIGLDDNGDSALDPGEIDNTFYICNGVAGTDGLDGDRYATTSTTSLTIGLGALSLTVDTGLAYTLGQTVIIAEPGLNSMEGSVTSYNPATGAMNVNVTNVNGGGTFASWDVNLAGAPGPAGNDGLNSLANSTIEAPGVNCTDGGQRIDVGLDDNDDGILQAGEIDDTYYICDGAAGAAGPAGANGTDGLNSLAVSSVEAPGVNCTDGGQRVDVGLDDNNDAILQAGEIDDTYYICDGATGPAGAVGAAGADGLNSLSTSTVEAPGVNCTDGGQRIDVGLDDNDDGILQAGEIDFTYYVCDGAVGATGTNGVDGLNSLSTSTVEAPGVNCSDGGQFVEVGLDDNDDGTLDPGEVDYSYYICDGAVGAAGTNGVDGLNSLSNATVELPGVNCTDGGQRIDVGLDDNNDGILQAGEIDYTYYVCDGAQGPAGADGDQYATNSTTLHPMTLGSKTWVVATGLAYTLGQTVIVAESGTNFLEGTVTAYNSGTGDLTVNVTNVTGGGGPYNSWAVNLAGAPGPAGNDGLNSLANSTIEAPGVNCTDGGQRIDVGLDDNDDGILQAGEIDDTYYICDGAAGAAGPAGANGTDGLNSLAVSSVEAPGVNCTDGGQRVDVGLDDNNDAILQAGEIDDTYYICDGATGPAGAVGAAGADGLNSLSNSTIEAPGVNCTDGGQRIDVGLDDNDDGILQAGEIDFTYYVCDGAIGAAGTNGTDGLNSLAASTIEAPGVNCTDGGQRLDVGLDNNDDGILQAGEIDFTYYVCDGAVGANGIDGLNSLAVSTVETPGVNCTDGGQRIDVGLDDNNDAILQAGEIDDTYYICDGAPGPSSLQAAYNGGQTIGMTGADIDITSSGAVPVLTIDDTNENVGIGTATPNANYQLDVVGGDIFVNGYTLGRGPGGQNTVFGLGTYNISTGVQNTVMGNGAGGGITQGNQNTAIGMSTLQFNTVGNRNTAIGKDALRGATGSDNVALGVEANENAGGALSNTAIGNYSLRVNTGNNNSALGIRSGFALTGGANNTFIGANADAGVATLSNATAIGAGAIVSQNNSLVLGNNANVGIGTSTPSNRLEVVGDAAKFDSVIIVNGAQAGYVLTSNASGEASWQAGASAHTLQAAYDGGQTINMGSGNIDFISSSANSVLYIDEANERVGIGNASPSYPLDILNTTSAFAINAITNFNAARNEGINSLVSGSVSENFGMSGRAVGGTLSIGVNGEASNASSSNIGVRGVGFNTSNTGWIVGTQGEVQGVTTATNAFGVNAVATSTGSTNNYGIFSTASGGTNNYAAYFENGDVIAENGNVGIGTATPNANLSIFGNTAGFVFEDITNLDPDGTVSLDFVNDANRMEFRYEGSNFADNSLVIYDDDDSQARLIIDDATGFVGIGDYTPDDKLDITDSLPADWVAVQVENLATDGIASFDLQTDAGYFGINTDGSTVGAGLDGDFYVANYNLGSTPLVINDADNVGIGETNPQQTLDVGGTVRIQSLGGSGPQIVSVDNNGDLSTLSIPSASLFSNIGNALEVTGDSIHLGGDLTKNVFINLINENFTIGNGSNNQGTGSFAFGIGNTIFGDRAYAIGSNIRANNIGSFVIGDWSGGSPGITQSSANDQFTARFDNGYRFFTNSDPVASPSEGLFIDPLGNVGMGTNSPVNQLDIEGGMVIGAVYSGSTTAPAQGLLVEGNVGIGSNVANAPLQLRAVVANRKIVLLEGANNDHQFFGFGVNPSILRYQVNGSSSSHVFYEGTNASSSSELMRIQGDGDVGIGTNNPLDKLHIAGGTIRLEDFAGNGRQMLTVNNTGVVGFIDLADSVNWARNGNDIYNTNTGNVGIGTMSPAQDLHISNSGAAGILVEAGNNSFISLDAGSTANTSNVNFRVIGSTVGRIRYSHNATPTSELMEFYVNGANRMFLDGNGNMAVGNNTIAPVRIYNFIEAANTTVTTGISNVNNYSGASSKFGTFNFVSSDGTGEKFGMASNVSGNAGSAFSVFGTNNEVTHPGNNGNVYGTRNIVSKPSAVNGLVYGDYIDMDNDGNSNGYMYYGNSTGTGSGVQFGVYISGEDRNYLSGRLGIGTLNPGVELEVENSSASITPQVIIENTNTGDAALSMQVAAQDWAIGIDNSDLDKFKIAASSLVSTSTALTIETGGDVGIGTSSPTEALEIANGGLFMSAATDNLIRFNTSGFAFPSLTTRSTGAKIVLWPEISGVNADFALGVGLNTQWYGVPNTGDAHRFYAGTAELMTIEGAGNVGIGVGNPLNKLHINSGTSAVPLRLDNTLAGNTAIQLYNNGTLSGWLQTTSTSTNLIAESTRDLDFYNNGSINMHIEGTNGNVGIGTIAPVYNLDVVGGTSGAENILSIFRTPFTTTGQGTGIRLSNTTNTNGNVGHVDIFAIRNATSIGELSIRPGGVEIIRATTAGVGVGTSNPNVEYWSPVNTSGVPTTLTISGTGTTYSDNSPAILELHGGGTSLNDEIGVINFTNFDPGGSNNYNFARISAHRENSNSTYSSLRFYTRLGASLTEQMRITPDGNIGIGAINPLSNAKLEVEASNDTYGIYVDQNTTTGTTYGVRVASTTSSGTEYGIYTTGEDRNFFQSSLTINGTTSQFYTLYITGPAFSNGGTWGASDRRWKKDIIDLEPSLSKLMDLRPVRYNWRADEFPDQKFDTANQIGLIAQEVEELFPEFIKEGDDGYKAVSYERLTTVLIQATKEQQKIIDNQESRISELEAANLSSDNKSNTIELDKAEYLKQKEELNALKSDIEEMKKLLYLNAKKE